MAKLNLLPVTGYELQHCSTDGEPDKHEITTTPVIALNVNRKNNKLSVVTIHGDLVGGRPWLAVKCPDGSFVCCGMLFDSQDEWIKFAHECMEDAHDDVCKECREAEGHAHE